MGTCGPVYHSSSSAPSSDSVRLRDVLSLFVLSDLVKRQHDIMTFFITAVLLCSYLASGVVAWGEEGHSAVGRIGQAFLTDDAQAFVSKQVGRTPPRRLRSSRSAGISSTISTVNCLRRRTGPTASGIVEDGNGEPSSVAQDLNLICSMQVGGPALRRRRGQALRPQLQLGSDP